MMMNGVPAAMGSSSNGMSTATTEQQHQPIVSVQDMTLLTPDGNRKLISNLSFDLFPNEHLLIVGASGAGKSSLLRAIAGLWTTGAGTITRPDNNDVYFLPQRPYCVLGSLRDQLLYPSLLEEEEEEESDDDQEKDVATMKNGDDGDNKSSNSNKKKKKKEEMATMISKSHRLKHAMTDQELLDILDQVSLGELASRVAATTPNGKGDPIAGLYKQDVDWSNMLSLGEQQRLAFGRVLVNEPKLVILDEATSALDVLAERNMYNLLKQMDGLTYVSVGHRPSLLMYHDKRLRLHGDDASSTSNNKKQNFEFGSIEETQRQMMAGTDVVAEETLQNL